MINFTVSCGKAFRLLLLFALLPASAAASSSVNTQSLNGVWDFRTVSGAYTVAKATDKAEGRWRNIDVPSNWYLAGVDHSGTAIYRRTFSVDRKKSDQSFFLVFHGVDYAADIWLNGGYAGSHEGYFQSFNFDVTDHIKTGDNILHIAVHSPKEDVGEVWSLRKQLIKGIFNHHDTRPGGAWSPRGQEKNTGGVWASVELKTTGPAALKNMVLTPSYDERRRGKAAIRFDIAGVNPRAADAVSIRLSPKNFPGNSITIDKRLEARRNGPVEVTVSLDEVRLWWPYDLGAPNLYEAEITLLSRGEKTDIARRTFGFRTVERDGASGVWRINGKRFFLRGTNYIATQWLSEMKDEDYDVDLALMRGAHINTVRVHAHIGAKPFYEAADRIGMLVWQDFPLQWGYDDSPEFLAKAQGQAADMVRLLNDHPSIIAWSMQNEPPWDADWMKYKYPDYDPEQNKTLTYALYETVRALDDTRHVHSHSATAEHPWLGWYSGSWLDYAKPTDQSLVTEFGAQALPNADGLRRIFPEDALFPDDEEDWALWDYHNFQKHELTTIAGVSIGSTVEEFIENTQSYQAKLTKFAAENLRRQKYNPVGGAFQFMFNEDWPSVNWGVVDYWRAPKPGYHALKEAYQPILASLEWTQYAFSPGDTVEVGLWVINDLYAEYENATYELSLRTPSEVVSAGAHIIDIHADDVSKIAVWRRTVTDPGEYVLVAHIRSANGELLSANTYAFTVE